jgi:hypothetical protein
MQQENQQFMFRMDARNKTQTEVIGELVVDVFPSPTVGEALTKLASMISNPTDKSSDTYEIKNLELYGNNKEIMRFPISHTGTQAVIRWPLVTLTDSSKDLLNALKETFPEQAGRLKGLALDESLGL